MLVFTHMSSLDYLDLCFFTAEIAKGLLRNDAERTLRFPL
jgi:hypothetical protein